ncbi:MAG: AtpZ/AtpI family protein [Mangrovibacterium sp.]
MIKLKPTKNDLKFLRYSSLAFEMVATMGLGVLAGIGLDRWLQTSPVFTLILMVLGVVAAIYHAIKNFIKP